MKLKEITPNTHLCTSFACPAIFELVGRDKLIIVGSEVNLEELGITHRVGRNEQAVMIEKEMLKRIFQK